MIHYERYFLSGLMCSEGVHSFVAATDSGPNTTDSRAIAESIECITTTDRGQGA